MPIARLIHIAPAAVVTLDQAYSVCKAAVKQAALKLTESGITMGTCPTPGCLDRTVSDEPRCQASSA